MRNLQAKLIKLPQFKLRVIRPKKGKGSYGIGIVKGKGRGKGKGKGWGGRDETLTTRR